MEAALEGGEGGAVLDGGGDDVRFAFLLQDRFGGRQGGAGRFVGGLAGGQEGFLARRPSNC